MSKQWSEEEFEAIDREATYGERYNDYATAYQQLILMVLDARAEVAALKQALAQSEQDRLEARFWVKVHKTANCWEWIASINRHGYGVFAIESRGKLAHRLAWGFTNGPITAGLHVLHSCDNRRCVNPAHLYLGTNKENVADRVARGREARHDGEHNGNAQLTRDIVTSIRRLAAEGVSRKEIREKFGLGRSAVDNIINNKSWRIADLRAEKKKAP